MSEPVRARSAVPQPLETPRQAWQEQGWPPVCACCGQSMYLSEVELASGVDLSRKIWTCLHCDHHQQAQTPL